MGLFQKDIFIYRFPSFPSVHTYPPVMADGPMDLAKIFFFWMASDQNDFFLEMLRTFVYIRTRPPARWLRVNVPENQNQENFKK